MNIKGWIGIGVLISTGVGAILGLIDGKKEEKKFIKSMELAEKEIELFKMMFGETDKQVTKKKENKPDLKEKTIRTFFVKEDKVSETRRRTMDELLGKREEHEENEHLRKSREIMEKMDYADPEDRIQMLKDALEETKKAIGDLYDDDSDLRMSLN